MRVWLDNDFEDRPAPPGFVHVTTAWQAILLLTTGRVQEIWLDHDLGCDDITGRGVDVTDWLAEQSFAHDRDLWPGQIVLLTANSHGRDSMEATIRRFGPGYREDLTRGGHRRFRLAVAT